MSKVSSISINGYKSIKNLEGFALGSLNVLVGPNGAGKSNFISAFKLLNEIVEERLQIYVQKSGGAHTLLYYGPKTTRNIDIQIKFGENGYHCKITPTDDDSLFFEEETSYFYGYGYKKNPYDEPLLSGDRKESGLNKKGTRVTGYVLDSIKSWHIYHFHDTSATAGLKQIAKIDDNRRLRADAANLASYLYLLQQKHNQEYQNIIRVIRLGAPFFGDFNLHPLERSIDSIKLEWKHKTSDEYFDATSLSDGTLRFICLATLLLQPDVKLPTTILLDEPELGLHPHAVTILAKMIKGASKKTQIIVSTQSTTLINQLDPEDLIVVDRDDEQSTFKRLAKEQTQQWIDDYGLGDLWEKNLFGGTP